MSQVRSAYESTPAVNSFTREIGLRSLERELVERFFQRNRAILDLGCGGGRTTVALHDLGYEAIGLDLSLPLLEAARKACPSVSFVHADVRALPFRDETFEQVLFSFNGLDCVFPLDDLRGAMREIRRVMKPSGVFIYSGHNIIGHFGRHLCSFRGALAMPLRVQLGFLAIQRRGSYPWKWYWRVDESFGDMITFTAPPWVRRRLHAAAGFDTIAVCGFTPDRTERWLTCHEHSIHYVVKKK